MGGGGAVRPPVVFRPLLKKSSGNPYLKILDFLTRVDYVCIEESFDTIFNMGCGGRTVLGDKNYHGFLKAQLPKECT